MSHKLTATDGHHPVHRWLTSPTGTPNAPWFATLLVGHNLSGGGGHTEIRPTQWPPDVVAVMNRRGTTHRWRLVMFVGPLPSRLEALAFIFQWEHRTRGPVARVVQGELLAARYNLEVYGDIGVLAGLPSALDAAAAAADSAAAAAVWNHMPNQQTVSAEGDSCQNADVVQTGGSPSQGST